MHQSLTYIIQFASYPPIIQLNEILHDNISFLQQTLKLFDFYENTLKRRLLIKTPQFVPHIGFWRYRLNYEYHYWFQHLYYSLRYNLPSIFPLYAATKKPKSINAVISPKISPHHTIRLNFYPNGVIMTKLGWQGDIKNSSLIPPHYLGKVLRFIEKSLFKSPPNKEHKLSQAWRIIFIQKEKSNVIDQLFAQSSFQEVENIEIGINTTINIKYYRQIRTWIITHTTLPRETRIKLFHCLEFALMQFVTLTSYIQSFKTLLKESSYEHRILTHYFRLLFWFYHPHLYAVRPRDFPKIFPIAWQRKTYEQIIQILDYKKIFEPLFQEVIALIRNNTPLVESISYLVDDKEITLLSNFLEFQPLDILEKLTPLEKKVLNYLIDAYLNDRNSTTLADDEIGLRHRSHLATNLGLSHKQLYNKKKFGEYPPVIESLRAKKLVLSKRHKFPHIKRCMYYKINLENQIIQKLLNSAQLRKKYLVSMETKLK